MPDLPTLYAASPLAIAATFDKLWIDEIVISAPQIGGEASAAIRLRLWRTTEDGPEAAPAEPIRLQVSDLLAGADADPDLANAVAAIMAYVGKVAAARGVVATE